MFNFFRRKKPVETETPAEAIEQIEQIEPVESAVAIETATEPTAAIVESVVEPVIDAIIEPATLLDAAPEAELEVEPEAEPETSPAPEAEPTLEIETLQANKSWFSRLKSGLSKTGKGIKNVFIAHKVDEAWFEQLEDALLMADVGVTATTQVLSAVRSRVNKERIEDASAVKQVVKDVLIGILKPLEKTLDVDAHKPLVLMIAGVNGAGKTTSIGKLTHHLQQQNKKIILAAGDTFRAAAREQLAAWGARNGVTVIAQESGDPAAVVFDAIASAKSKNIDVVIADTAGRLPTQLNLMDELKKIKRVAEKSMAGAPHEVILVLDGSMGQNALAQVKAFDEAVALTGLIITKLDGSAKGGVLAALAVERHIPVYFIGVGEGVHDLQTFDAVEFVDALLDE